MSVERCPCCNQVLRQPDTPIKECYDCGQPIPRTHKYTFQRRPGVPVAVTVHRCCVNPESYYRTAECKRIGVVGYRSMTREQIQEATAREEELEAQFQQWRLENGRELGE